MGWDRKDRGPEGGYFYKSVRLPHKPYPVKVYLGRGEDAHRAAAELQRRKEGRTRARAPTGAPAEADRLAAELSEWAATLAACWLVLTGHHYHRGEWRRGMTKKPRVGSRAWEETLHQDPVYLRNTLQSLAERAARGDAGATEDLDRLLAD